MVSIVVAPSARLTTLAALLQATARAQGVEGALEVRALEDLYELATPRTDRGQLVLDADGFELEDLGLVRRFVARSPSWQLGVVGVDATRSVARALLSLDNARWIAWPLDVLQLEGWVRALAPAEARPARAAVTGAPAGHGAIDLHAQVATLADISQRLELAFAAWREAGRGAPSDAEGASAELRRLMRFTRTLSCTIAPPPRGSDEFDPAALIDEQLTNSALRGRKGPRFVARAPSEGRGGYLVRADRGAIALAVEAVLSLASQCASAGDVVRILYAQQDGELAITVEFPAGPLSGLAPEHLLEPSVIRERLSDYGVNDLPAAAAILRSQGGEFALADAGTGALTVQLRLPLVTAPPARGGASSGASVPPSRGTPVRAANG